MTDAPIWPGVAEYLYHAASPAAVRSDGTWIEPSALTPRCSSLEFTPMAGIATDTGSERRSDGPRVDPMAPAAAGDGCGACTWAAIATPAAATPPTIRMTPVTPATRARRPASGPGRGSYRLCRHTMTTRNPAMRRHCRSPNAASPPSSFPTLIFSRNLIFSGEQAIAHPAG